jgi:hypothetical protein
MYRFLLPFCLVLIITSPALSQEAIPYLNLSIQNGDLLFVGAQKENLSGAINRVTQQKNNVSFDHVGLIEVENSQAFIIHAIGRKGSVREPLDSLIFGNSDQDQTFVLYRLTEKLQAAIPEAIEVSKTLLGLPYNWSYVMNDSSLYCSDLVERAFRHAELFKLEPMTFLNPSTKQTDAFWLEYYQKLGIEVPEGQLGCNPNGLAANEKLNRIGEFKKGDSALNSANIPDLK